MLTLPIRVYVLNRISAQTEWISLLMRLIQIDNLV